MMRKLILAWGCCCLIACNAPSSFDIPVLKPDPGSGKDYFLDKLTDSIVIVGLDSVLLGDIDVVKSCGNLLALLDGHHSMIHLFDMDGHHINTLARHGRGPQEYVDIASFSIHPSGEYLIIYSRAGKLIRYSLPDLQFEDSEEVQEYYNAIEFIDGDNMLRTREYDATDGGIEMYNFSQAKAEDLAIKPSYPSLELCVDPTISNRGEGMFWLCYPSAINTVYSIAADSVSPVYFIDFGRYSISRQLWNARIDSDTDAGEIMAEKPHAIMPQHFLSSDDVLSFWYLVSHSGPSMQLYAFDRNDNLGRDIKQLKIEGYEGPITPVGSKNGFYISLLNQSLFSTADGSMLNDRLSKMFSESNVTDKTILLMYRLKGEL